MLYETHKAEIDNLLTRYADRRSAVLPLLYLAQDTYGHLTTDAIREVAEVLQMPYTNVFEVVGFYTLFYEKPVGKWVVQVCDDVPCCYLGAEELVATLEKQLGVPTDQISADGMFTVQRVKCLAACDRAPVVQANLDYIYDVTVERAEALLHALRQRAAGGEALSISGQRAADYEWDGATLRRIERDMGPDPRGQAEPAAPEPAKAATTEPEVAPEEARAAAEEQIAAESPVSPAPDRSPAGAYPEPGKADQQGAVPAQAPQQEPPQTKDGAPGPAENPQKREP